MYSEKWRNVQTKLLFSVGMGLCIAGAAYGGHPGTAVFLTLWMILVFYVVEQRMKLR
jgi:hypothetical protein